MRRNKKNAIATSILAALLAAGPAYANCVWLGSVENEFKQSSVVFMGTLIGSRREPIRYAAHPEVRDFMEFADFQVDIGWKGVQPGEIVHFKTSSGSGETYNVRNDPPIMFWEKSRWAAKKNAPASDCVKHLDYLRLWKTALSIEHLHAVTSHKLARAFSGRRSRQNRAQEC